MSRVFIFEDFLEVGKQVDDIFMCVGLTDSSNKESFHAGVAFYDQSTQQLNVLHLWTHNCLRFQKISEIRGDYRLFQLDFSPDDMLIALGNLVAYCIKHSLDRRNKPIPFGHCQPDLKFNDDYEFEFRQGETGFTCSSFVVALFNSFSQPIFQLATWPDLSLCEWSPHHEKVLAIAQHAKADKAHLLRLTQTKPFIRIDPLELGSVAFSTTPVSYQTALSHKEQVKTLIYNYPPPK